MTANAAGGFVFRLDARSRLRRFLVLGSDTPTFYADSRSLTLGNVEGVLAALREDGLGAVAEIVAVSEGGRAPNNDPALYALALAASYGARGAPGVELAADAPLADRLARSGDPAAPAVRRAALDALPRVARTAAHALVFVGFLESLRGWGRGPRRALARWFESLDDSRLALQAVKYRVRGGWAMRDLLRLSHPRIAGEDRRVLVEWILRRDLDEADIRAHDDRLRAAGDSRSATPRRHAVRPGPEVVADARARLPLIDGHHRVAEAASAREAARAVRDFGLPHECVPQRFLDAPEVWEALLPSMPMGALVRNLNRMTAAGLLRPGSEAARHVAERLTDEGALRAARVHPFRMLVALRVYQSGRGILGDLSWDPAREVVDALDAGFYAAFGAVEATGRRHVLGLDVSVSMRASFLAGAWKGRTPVRGPVSARVASAAMALVTIASEPGCFVGGFTAGRGASGDGFTPLDVSPRRRLDDVVRSVSDLPFGGTDAALPIAYAARHGIPADAFVIYTDNETWAGREAVTQALRRYRDRTGIPARLVAVGMTATEYSVADPADPLQANVVGFDADAPAIIADFVRG